MKCLWKYVLPLVLGALSIAATVAAADGRNVLVFITDNQNWDDLGCYGNRVLQTPNIDRLAANGVRFQQAFATSASCGPSRGVIYTGLLTHANGQYGHPHAYHNFVLRPEARPVFSLLHEAGYRTGLIGKDHLGVRDEADHARFRPRLPPRDVRRIAESAAEFFAAGDEPFVLFVSYHEPHPTSREGAGWSVADEVRLPSTPRYDPAEVLVPRYLPDRPEVRAGLAGYYEQISQVDGGVGLVLQHLADAGKADNTLVLFFSDHGSSEPGAMSFQYEPGVRIPFLAYHPGLKQPGLVSPALVTLADVVPTILDWTGAAPPAYPLHGRSIVPILEQDQPAGWDEVLLSHCFHEVTMYYPMRTLRGQRYKLIWNLVHEQPFPLPIDTLARATWQESLARGDEYFGPRKVEKLLYHDEVELYDLETDPDEVVNLANDPRHRELRRAMSKRLVTELHRTGDPWLLRHTLPVP